MSIISSRDSCILPSLYVQKKINKSFMVFALIQLYKFCIFILIKESVLWVYDKKFCYKTVILNS